MNTDTLIGLTSQGLLLCLYISLPAIIVSALSGLIVAFLQAITSLQDQTISHSVKLFAVIGTLLLTAGWGGTTILRFALRLLSAAVPT
ncbi:EscS/YscS/HrcS family type III secretion system export apparatus protein [Burkholderia cenocepacia]|jgi:type III secretion protein S|uniref:EscS/YscS/HrcS family type III secretion system export apparatus protein n=2 Tax=Burkholderia cepacia complex TaxID=87882 RepID=A0A2S8IVB3_BURCE|nr:MULTISPECIES: type III secretion system export apparatus subunit SctS [Burkholderia]ACA95048.1 type III secretion protein, HrpO family [Burkholderia orbicola MC0-3]EKS9885351.1 type III secretion system export apparatus subunit SctS [Burkholderia pyrrocinia]EKS9894680.1 type III secretion system export apparatus subunit SctS [Burkholderia pyrrocinia]EKS9906973.1 type III secretion system export apparatus subunit SctS [Burkholderia pyrrocinia]KFL54859.1 aldolase [Burkholderia pyrrocinia]